MIDIERTLRLLDVEAESNLVQAEAIDAINYLLRENARLRAALNGWQKWWELPWEGKRPDFAELVYRRAAAIAKASAVNPRDEGAPTI